MSYEENSGYEQKQPKPGLLPTTSAELHASGGLVSLIGIPHVSTQVGNLVLGDSTTSSQRSFTVIQKLGKGSFGSVFLCDWHGDLPPDAVSGGTRLERTGMRLVAVKVLKRRWEHGWDECKHLKELKALRALAPHPCVIPLYDVFLACETSELYFVFECMEGNLYKFIRARKGRPLATGLLACIFQQMAAGLHHIHSSGYFHRDVKPENVLVTTAELFDYRSPSSSRSQPDAAAAAGQMEMEMEMDLKVICKIADFDSAREISSTPPYTEYVSARWYRAPEVLLKQRDYSAPVDMWALGTVMAEMVNLKPIFPGSGEVDQINRIVKVLGDPADYGVDECGRPYGGGPWSHGLALARHLGFTFPKTEPRYLHAILDEQTPRELVECISDLLKFDPNLRLTSQQCLEHEYLRECLPENPPFLRPGVENRAPNQLSRAQDSHGVIDLPIGMKSAL